MVVIKRNGTERPYHSRKVRLAISKANQGLPKEEQATEEQIDFICNRIESMGESKIHVEKIQDIIENHLMNFGLNNLAKKYIIYRYNHMLARRANTTDSSILSLVRGSNEDVIRENSNKDAYAVSTQRDLIAGEVSKDLTWRHLLPQDIVEAHMDGVLHFHDADYFLQPLFNCCLINIKDMLDNGTMIHGVLIESPKSFRVACNIMTQIIASVASSQYGGQSVDIKHLGKYLALSRDKIRNKTIERWKESGIAYTEEHLDKEVEVLLKQELKDGVQTIQYQINTLLTVNGQSPFLTLFLHIDDNDPYVDEVAMIVEEIIKQRIEGVKNKNGVYVTPAFPKLVYVLDENNCLRGGKYDYITKLCAICNTKRIYPDYISAKVMREIHDGEVYSPMGCVDGKEVIQYKYNDTLYTESFERMWRRLSDEFPTKLQHPDHKDMYMDVKGVSIWDNNLGEFTEVYRVIQNISDSWLNLKFSNGRSLRVTRDHPFETKNRGVVLAENLTESDQILVDKGFSVEGTEDLITPEEAWFTGVCLCDSSYSSVLNISLGDDEKDIQNKLTEIAEKDFALEMYKFHHDRGDKGIYTDLRARGNGNTSISIRRDLEDIFEGIKKVDRHIPNTIFSCSYDVRLAFLCGMIDADGHIKYNNRLSTVELGSTNKELALQEMLLAQSLGFKARVYQNHYCSSDRDKIRFRVEFDASSELLKYLVSGKKRDKVDDTFRVNNSNFTDDYCTLTEREELDYTDFSYDVTTASEHFSVSGLYSHNCRSFLGEWQNENGDYVWEGRFNQGVVSLNLPQIGLVADGNMDIFWEELEKRLSLCFKALMCRHKALEGTVSDVSPIHWQNGAIARLESGEKIDKLLHGGYSTISLGYIGIYEMTVAMLGVSHTTPEGLEFATKVLNRLKEAVLSWKKETGIGFALYGTPAESLCYRFCEIDKKKFGVIEDITDKGWYTNSYHLDVREEINAFDKLAFEAQFQKISTGGCISYVELPNLDNNVEAVEELIKYLYDTIMYAEFNSKSDYCLECGYSGEIVTVEDENGDLVWECPCCGNRNQKTMLITRRTCGYLGQQYWNVGKTKEIASRVLHL